MGMSAVATCPANRPVFRRRGVSRAWGVLLLDILSPDVFFLPPIIGYRRHKLCFHERPPKTRRSLPRLFALCKGDWRSIGGGLTLTLASLTLHSSSVTHTSPYLHCHLLHDYYHDCHPLHCYTTTTVISTVTTKSSAIQVWGALSGPQHIGFLEIYDYTRCGVPRLIFQSLDLQPYNYSAGLLRSWNPKMWNNNNPPNLSRLVSQTGRLGRIQYQMIGCAI